MTDNSDLIPPSYQHSSWITTFKTPSPFLELPGELRNIIYELCFDIQYDATSEDRDPLIWHRIPRGLSKLFLTCSQIHEEASSMFYRDFFPHFEYLPVSFLQLHDFTSKVPEDHRDKFRATISLLVLNGDEILHRVGLHRRLPWTIGSIETKSDPVARQIEKRLRGDCFFCTHFSSYGGPAGNRHDYDRIVMTGHLGRLEWAENRPMIIYRPPNALQEKIALLKESLVTSGAGLQA